MQFVLQCGNVKPYRKIVAELIGFDRRERRGTYVLSVVVLLLLLVRITLLRPGKVPDNLAPLPVPMTEDLAGSQPEAALFSFDPNSISYEDLLKLGLTGKQAHTLVNYRSSGARFRWPEELGRVYGIDSATVARLIPYIHIRDDYAVRSGDNSSTGSYVRGGDNSGTGSYVRSGDNSGTGGSTGGRKETVPVSVRATDGADIPEAIDLNLCTAEDLVTLPGIGPVLSVRIIRYRSLLGGFVSTGQLTEVYGLDTSVVKQIAGRLTLTFDSVRALLPDSATFGELARHPYLGYEAARQITRYRRMTDEPLTLGELVEKGVITHRQAERIAPYVLPAAGIERDEYEFILSKVLK